VTDHADAELTQAAGHLLARYAWAIDDRAYDDLLDVFTEDVVADYGPFTCRGAAAVVARMEELHRDLLTTQHLVGSVLACAEPDGSATVRSHVRATLVRGRGERERVEVAATYRDRMVLTPAGLRIAERRVQGRWVAGERSILPWFRERPPGTTSEDLAPTGASATHPEGGRVDLSETTSAAPRSTSPDDRGA
jgi:3-phenylpropionate/cinnamic acid dioxygenase small subunit